MTFLITVPLLVVAIIAPCTFGALTSPGGNGVGLTSLGEDGSVAKFRIRKHASYVVQDGDILQRYNVSPGRCVRACAVRPRCQLINYRRYFAQCRLYSTGLTSLTLRDEKNSVVLGRNDIKHEPLPGGCTNCGVQQECDLGAGDCKAAVCPSPPEVENGKVYGNMRNIGSRLEVTCDAGFKLANESGQVTCLPGGQWSATPSCIPDIIEVCPFPLPEVEHGQVEGTERTIGSRLEVTCDAGFKLANGNGQVTCQTGGGWSSTPSCIPECPAAPEVINANRVADYTSATFTCLYHGGQAPFTATCSPTTGTWENMDTCYGTDVCEGYLVPGIPDTSLTASTDYNTGHGPEGARLGTMDGPNGAGAWVPHDVDTDAWIQAKFDVLKHVTGVVTAGRGGVTFVQYVKTYNVKLSRDCDAFDYVRDQQGHVKEFLGNTDTTTLVRNMLPEPVDVLCIRLYPLAHENYRSLRFDVIGCTGECATPLVPGLPDSSLTSSTNHDLRHEAHHARLGTMLIPNVSAGSWVAGGTDIDPKAWIQAKFDALKHVTGVVTSGRGTEVSYEQYVKTYYVKHSRDCETFEDVRDQQGNLKMFQGNTDATTLVTNMLPEPVDALCIRLYPLDYNGDRSLRFDVVGCPDCFMVYLVSGTYGVADSSLTASLEYEDDDGGKSAPAVQARLDARETESYYGAWGVPDEAVLDLYQTTNSMPFIQLFVALLTESHYSGWVVADETVLERYQMSNSIHVPFMQVKFRQPQRVSSVVTQGLEIPASWVTSYHVTYSADCATFTSIRDGSGNIKLFEANTDAVSKVENVLPFVVRARCVRIEPVTYEQHLALRFDVKGCVDYVCPKSAERFITPNVRSPLALRIMPGEFSHQGATSACGAHGRLAILSTTDLESTVVDIINNCLMYADRGYWVDGQFDLHSPHHITFSDGTRREFQYNGNVQGDADTQYTESLCVALAPLLDTVQLQIYRCTETLGYICEKMPEAEVIVPVA